MRFILRGPFQENIYQLMRGVGYHFEGKDEKTEEFNFVRPPRGYPRFHLFLKIEGEDLIFNLHLDQKKPIYKGAPAHAGEYDGDLVEKEAESIRQTLQK